MVIKSVSYLLLMHVFFYFLRIKVPCLTHFLWLILFGYSVKVSAKKAKKAVKKTLSATITVKTPVVKFKDAAGKQINTLDVVMGDTVTLNAASAPKSSKITFTSSDATIATVDATGKLTPVKAGKVVVQAKNALGATALLTVNVVDANTVKSAEVLNAKQIKVTFNTVVDETDAKKVANYSLASVLVSNIEKVSDTEYVLTFASNIADDTERAFTVKAIKTKADATVKTAQFDTKIKTKDTTAATVTEVKAATNGDKAGTATVTFSEPVMSASAYSIDGTAVSPVFNATATTATFTKDLDATKAHTFQVIGLKDFAGNTTELQTVSFNVTVDKTQPTVSIAAEGENTIKLTFSKDVTVPAGAVTVKNAATGVVVATPSVTGSGKEYTTTINPSFGAGTTVSYIVEVNDTVLDTLGNKLVKASQTISFTKDVTKPVLQSISVNKTDDGKVKEIVISASENINTVTGSPVVVDKDGKIVNTFDGTATVKDNTVVIALATPAVITGKYTFNFSTGYVTDKSLSANKSGAASLVYDFGAATDAPAAALTATVATTGTNKYTVTFNDTVTTASAENAANYALNGAALPANTKVSLDSTLKIVTIELPAGSIASTNTASYLTVSGVVSYKGVTVTTTTQKVDVTDNTAPTIVSATLTANGSVVIKFSEKLDTATVDATAFTYDGKALSADATVTAADDTVTISGATFEAGKKVAVVKDTVKDLAGNFGAAGEVVIQ